ncbi:uncharacterized protein LOC144790705 [Lissotriton helveticus]
MAAAISRNKRTPKMRTTQTSTTATTRISTNGTTRGITPTTENYRSATARTANTETSKPSTVNTTTAARITTLGQSTGSGVALGTLTQVKSGSTNKDITINSSLSPEIVSTATITTQAITAASTPIEGHTTGSSLALGTLTQVESGSTSKGITANSSLGPGIVSTVTITTHALTTASTTIGEHTTGNNLALGTLTQVESGSTSKGITTNSSLSMEIVSTAPITTRAITAASTTIGGHTTGSKQALGTLSQVESSSTSKGISTNSSLSKEIVSTEAITIHNITAAGTTIGGHTIGSNQALGTLSQVENSSTSKGISTNSSLSTEIVSTAAITTRAITAASTTIGGHTTGSKQALGTLSQVESSSTSKGISTNSSLNKEIVSTEAITIHNITAAGTTIGGHTIGSNQALGTLSQVESSSTSKGISTNSSLSTEIVSTAAITTRAITATSTTIGGHTTGSNQALGTLSQVASSSTSKGISTNSSLSKEIVSTEAITIHNITAAGTTIGGHTIGSNQTLGTLSQVENSSTSKGISTNSSLSTEIVSTAAITTRAITAASTTIGGHTTGSKQALGTLSQVESSSTSKGISTNSSLNKEIVSTEAITIHNITAAGTTIGGHTIGSNQALGTLSQVESSSTSKGISTNSSLSTEIVSTAAITTRAITATSTTIGGHTTGSNQALGTLSQVASSSTSKGISTNSSLSKEIVSTEAIAIHNITAAGTTIGGHTTDSKFATGTMTQVKDGSTSTDFTIIASIGMETENTTAMATGNVIAANTSPGGSTTKQIPGISKSTWSGLTATSTPIKVGSTNSGFSTNSNISMETASTTAIVISNITAASAPPSESTTGRSWVSLKSTWSSLAAVPSTHVKDGSFSNGFTGSSDVSMNKVTSSVIALASNTPASTANSLIMEAARTTAAVINTTTTASTTGRGSITGSSIGAGNVTQKKDTSTIKDITRNFSLNTETGDISPFATDGITVASTVGGKTTTGQNWEALKSTGSSLAVGTSTQEKGGVSNIVFTKDSGPDMVTAITTGEAMVSFTASATKTREATPEQNLDAKTLTQVRSVSISNGLTTKSRLSGETGTSAVFMINTGTTAITQARESSTGQRWESLKSTDMGTSEGILSQAKDTSSSVGYTIEFGNLKPPISSEITTPRAPHSTAFIQISTGSLIKGITAPSSSTEVLTPTIVNDYPSIHPSERVVIKAFDPIAVTEHGSDTLINNTISARTTALVNRTSEKETLLSNQTYKSVTTTSEGGTSMVEIRTETPKQSITSQSTKAKDDGRTYPVTETISSNTSIETTTHRAEPLIPLQQTISQTNAVKTNWENTTRAQDDSISVKVFSKTSEDITAIKSSTSTYSIISTQVKVTSENPVNPRTTESITAGTTFSPAQVISDSTALENTSANDHVIYTALKTSSEDKISTNASQFAPATTNLNASAPTGSSNVTIVKASNITTIKDSISMIADPIVGSTVNIETFKSTSTKGIMVQTTSRKPVATTTPKSITTIANNILPPDFLNSRSFENPNTQDIKANTTSPTSSEGLPNTVGSETMSSRVTNSTVQQLSQNNIIKNTTANITTPLGQASGSTSESINNGKSMVTSTNTPAFKQVSLENQVGNNKTPETTITRVVITSRSSLTGDTTTVRKGSTTTGPTATQRAPSDVTSAGRTSNPSTPGTGDTHIHLSLGLSTLLNLTDTAVRERILQQLNQFMRKWFPYSNMTLTWKSGRVK